MQTASLSAANREIDNAVSITASKNFFISENNIYRFGIVYADAEGYGAAFFLSGAGDDNVGRIEAHYR